MKRRFGGWKIALQAIVLAGMMVYLFSRLEWDQVFRLLSGVHPLWLTATLGGNLVVIWLNALRWKVLFQATSPTRPPLWRLTYSEFVGTFFNSFLPTSSGGDIFKIYDLFQHCRSIDRAAISVLAARTFGLLAMGLFIVWGLVWNRPLVHLESVVWLAGGYGAICLTALVLIFFRALPFAWIEKILLKWQQKTALIQNLSGFVREIRQTIQSRSTMGVSLLLSLTAQFLSVASIFGYGQALGLVLPLGGLVLLVPIIALICFLPLSINALGIQEGAYVFLFGWMGLTGEQALSIALLLRLVMGVIVPGLGGLLFLMLRGKVTWEALGLAPNGAPGGPTQKNRSP